MRHYVISTLLALGLGMNAAWADDSHHPKQGGDTTAPAASGSSSQGMGMMDMDRM